MFGLRFCARAFSSCGKRGPLFITVHRPLTIVASLVAEHRLQMRRLSSCVWDLPRPGLKPVSPALAGRFSTTVPPGKPKTLFLKSRVTSIFQRRRKKKLWKTLCLLDLKSQNTRQECIYELVIGNHWLSTVIKYSGLGRIIVLTWYRE